MSDPRRSAQRGLPALPGLPWLPAPHIALRTLLTGRLSPAKLAGPAALSALAQVLTLLQGDAFVGAVNKARTGGETGPDGKPAGLFGPLALALGLTSAGLGTQYLRRRAWRQAALAFREQLRAQLLDAVVQQDLAFFEEHGTGQLINLITEDTRRVADLIEQLPDQLIEKAITALYAGITLVKLSPKLALGAAIPLPFLFLPSLLLGAGTARRFAKAGAMRGDFAQSLESLLSGVTDVKLFQSETREAGRLREADAEMNEALVEASSAATAVGLLTQGIGATSFALVAAYGGSQVRKGKILPGDFARVLYLYPMLLSAVADIEGLLGTYHEAAAAAARINAVLESRPRITGGAVRLPLEQVQGRFEVKDLSFSYANGRQVLDGVSFGAKRGEMVAVVGRTGSGKSTLLKLLARLYEPDSGCIALDGHDLRDLETADLRRAVGLVSQETYLFEGSIRDNLLYGKLDATDAELRAALDAAEALEIVDRLPEGLDSPVGGRGGRLSGGERQRIAIARTVLRGAPVLLLDEITSHLDYETEDMIRRSIDRIAPSRTIVVVTHRLATIRHAARIVVLEQGRVSEIGTHDELVAKGGVYAGLWALQTGANPAPAPAKPRRRRKPSSIPLPPAGEGGSREAAEG